MISTAFYRHPFYCHVVIGFAISSPDNSIQLDTTHMIWTINYCNNWNKFYKKKTAHSLLTDWGRVRHIFVSKLTTIGSGYGLSPGRLQATIWTNAGILLIGPFETSFNEILIEMYTFSFKKMHLKMSSGKWRVLCLGLNVLIQVQGTVLHALLSLLGDFPLGLPQTRTFSMYFSHQMNWFVLERLFEKLHSIY